MPELAEVDYFRRQWDSGLRKKILRVHLNEKVHVFRGIDVGQLTSALVGQSLARSESHGKQMVFVTALGDWIGVHLGMAGKLLTAPAETVPDKHDHLVLYQAGQALVFRDTRHFGRILFHAGPEEPEWWSQRPPSLLSDAFDREDLAAFLKRRSRSPIKAVLLMQERFPGIGNWMADEILWRARMKPQTPAGMISGRKLTDLFREIRFVCQGAMDTIAVDWSDPPESWLFNHRWRDGGICPKTGKPLVREEIGGRTTCWSPAWQKWPNKL